LVFLLLVSRLGLHEIMSERIFRLGVVRSLSRDHQASAREAAAGVSLLMHSQNKCNEWSALDTW
jgi:hypothetical protein